MGWKERMKEFGGGDFEFLSEDGETIIFIVVDEPVLLEGKYKGKPSDKIGCPIVTQDGFVLFISGKRLARKISKYEDRFADVAFMAIRHGEQGDIEATYELKILDDAELVNDLKGRYNAPELPALIEAAVEAALEVMKG